MFFLRKLKKHKPFINKRGYRQIYMPNHPEARPSGYVHEHRVVALEKYGEIPAGMVVHHKNGNKLDNRKRNLKLMTREKHSRLHYKKNIKNKKM